MIAENNDILASATESLYRLNADELIREQCQAREDFEKHERTQQKKLADQEAMIKELTGTISGQADIISDLSSQNTRLNAEIALLRAELEMIKGGS